MEKTLNSNYNKGKIAAQQQFKFSLNPEFTNLELIGQRFNSKSVFEKDRNNPEECHTSYSIVYHLVDIILESLPDGIYKNLDNQYHRIIEEYDARQRKGRENILTCDICHGKSFRFWKRKGREKMYLNVTLAMENLFAFEASFCR